MGFGSRNIRLTAATVAGMLLASGCATTAELSPEPAEPSNPPPSVEVVDTVATDLNVPWGVTTTAEGSFLISERDTARILLLGPDGSVDELGTLPGVDPEGEGGLLGLAIPPGSTGEFLAYFTTSADNRVVSVAWDETGLGDITPILTGIPRASFHDGGRIAFGPDGMLYVATGDAGQPELAQDLNSLAGKVLRMTADGSVPADNPFPDSLVFTLGHRNVQGLAFDSEDRIWASEFGTSVADELNLLVPGGNYGWPIVEGTAENPDFIDPIAQWSPTSLASPSGIAFLGGESPAVYVASLRGEVLWQVPVVGDRAGEPIALDLGDLGRLRTVIATDANTLWLTTSNRDGRGDPRAADDQILALRVT